MVFKTLPTILFPSLRNYPVASDQGRWGKAQKGPDSDVPVLKQFSLAKEKGDFAIFFS